MSTLISLIIPYSKWFGIDGFYNTNKPIETESETINLSDNLSITINSIYRNYI